MQIFFEHFRETGTDHTMKRKRMTRKQALDLFLSSDLIGLGTEADTARRNAHPDDVVTYALGERIFSGTDADCCQAEAESSGIRIPLASQSSVEDLEETLRALRKKFPSLQMLVCASEILLLARRSHFSLEDALFRLHSAGLDSIADNEALAMDDWLAVHRAAHRAQMKTTAHFIFGAGEGLEQRLDLLDRVSDVQKETGGFIALAPRSHAPARELDAPTGVEYLKMVAICRLYLPEIPHVQASSTAQGLKMLQMALRFGADDAGPVPSHATEEDVRRIIRDAGFRPAQRDLLYRMMVLN